MPESAGRTKRRCSCFERFDGGCEAEGCFRKFCYRGECGATLTRIAPDDASDRRGDPTSPRKRGEVKTAGIQHHNAAGYREKRS